MECADILKAAKVHINLPASHGVQNQ